MSSSTYIGGFLMSMAAARRRVSNPCRLVRQVKEVSWLEPRLREPRPLPPCVAGESGSHATVPRKVAGVVANRDGLRNHGADSAVWTTELDFVRNSCGFKATDFVISPLRIVMASDCDASRNMARVNL